ncbi:MAG: hypothetical protein IT180_03310 [Acidobacteria bacterium]|nr:hypothetical protein [Acidobacteriota bacterium]
MEPLALVERRLQPEVSCAWQDPLGERQNALHREFVDLGVPHTTTDDSAMK